MHGFEHSSRMLRRYAVAAAGAWTMLVASALLWDLGQHRDEVENLARNQARLAFEKDLLVRRWAVLHGGVYVPVTKETPPNPALAHLPERDLTTPSGRRLTLLNPAYMTRQLHEQQRLHSDIRGHLTSLNPINPDNAPDPWETGALQAFQRGAPEFSELTSIDGLPYLRLMRPLRTEKGCLACHAAQGYREGDVRGGISVAVPLQPLLDAERENERRLYAVYGTAWLIVLALIFAGSRKLVQQARERNEAQAALREANESLEHRIRERTVELESAVMMMQGEMEDRVKAEQELEQSHDALRESERRLRSVLENMPLLGVGLNRESEIIFCNRTLLEATGWKAEEVLTRNWFELFVADGAGARKAFQAQLGDPGAEHGSRQHESEIRTRQGARLLVRWSSTMLHGPDGSVIGAMSMGEDITERRKAEEAARRDEQRLRSLVRLSQRPAGTVAEFRRQAMDEVLRLLDSPLGVWGVYDHETGELAVHRYSRDGETIIAHAAEICRLDQCGAWGEAVRQRMPILNNGADPGGLASSDGRTFPVVRSISLPLLSASRVVGVIGLANRGSDYSDLDIRQLDQIAEALLPIIEQKRSEERFRALIDQAPVAIRIGRNIRTIYANPRFLEVFGFASPEEVLGLPLTDQYAPEVRDEIADRARRRESGLYAPESYETTGMRKDGSRFPLQVSITRAALEDGHATIGFFEDITDRRDAEEKLRSSEERFRGIFDQASVGVIVTDLRGRLVSVNPAFCAISGTQADEVFGVEYASLTHPDDRGGERELFRSLLAGERESYQLEKRYHERDERVIWVSEALSLLRGADGQPMGITAVIKDVTERRRAEDALRRLNADLEQRVMDRTAALAEANSKLEKLATEDGLTGLPNRRHLDQTLDRELSRGLRTADMLSFLMCDVDFFKRYNDRYGHAEGDACLKRIAAALRAAFKRASDLPARYGGEEFSVIIPNTPPAHVLQLAEALRQRVEREALPHEGSDAAPVVTISIGVVSAPITGERSRAWYIKKADEALYRSKSDGRNRVTHTIE